MRFFTVTALFAGLLAANDVASAQSTDAIDPFGPPDPTTELPLEGEALRALFMDHTHRGYYNYGDWTDADPAFTEEMRADGTTRHDHDGIIAEGRWKVRYTVVCFEYEILDGGCFNIFQRGNCYYAMSAGTAELVAITVLDGETPDCEPSLA
ncbi:hypothetical protein ACFFUB_12105 [Algimonas porphyrae]|uniref:Uncharacterized protein n=1 Tax=Algimonas porphyrae TaxID=1128113 RepID=A0ABQ5UV51_9PROT|nr:hypothetical protein [Algimonas porphyrae]GLQ19151.1 hypothetical protein GCM10007854_01060 [Algimonas porphyrae]